MYACDFSSSDSIQLVYCSHPRWPLPIGSAEVSDQTSARDVIDISILDSSFNPPTLAHLALSQLSKTSAGVTTQFDAKLLLYSMKNADKNPTPGDATPSERVEMMTLLAKDMISTSANKNNLVDANVAVAVCAEPIFVEKSKILRAYFLSRIANLSVPSTAVRLTFLMGIDTLERLFMPRYYGTEDAMWTALQTLLASPADDSRVLCAHRAFGASYQCSDKNWMAKAKHFVDSGAVTFTTIDEETSALSSSEVRKSIRLDKSVLWENQVLDLIAQYIKDRGLYRGQ